jgi:hypothetical protein
MQRSGTALLTTLLATAFAFSAPAPLDRGVRLEWQFVSDKPFYQKTVTHTTQKMKVGGNDVDQSQKQTMVARWTPVKQLPDRSWLVKFKIQSIQMDLEIAGNKLSFDSAKPDPNSPLAEVVQAFTGAELTLTISPRKKILKVDGREALLAKLANANPALKPVLEATLSESALKEMANPLFAPLPGKSVKKGERWAEESKVDMGALGTLATVSNYVFEGPDSANRTLAKIVVKQKLTYAPPEKGAAALPFKVVSTDYKKAEASGTVHVHLKKGRLERSEITTRLAGKMTLDIGGMNTDIEVDQTQKVTVTTSDTPPAAEKKKE